MFKSEGKLREGLRRLGSLKGWLPKLSAETPHYLIGALECRNLLEIAEIHIKACLERKESRGNYFRVDFPETDPDMDNKFLCQRIEGVKEILELREHVPLKPEFLREAEEEKAKLQTNDQID
jgi:succinate dehydrogenase/fumarate reductase flavoprotein subunit